MKYCWFTMKITVVEYSESLNRYWPNLYHPFIVKLTVHGINYLFWRTEYRVYSTFLLPRAHLLVFTWNKLFSFYFHKLKENARRLILHGSIEATVDHVGARQMLWRGEFAVWIYLYIAKKGHWLIYWHK